MKCSFFQAVVVAILLYGCTTWTLTKWLEKKLDGNYTWMLWAILNKSWQQQGTNYTATCLTSWKLSKLNEPDMQDTPHMAEQKQDDQLELTYSSYVSRNIKVKLATVVKDDQKAPFSIATTPRCRGRVLLISVDCSFLPLIRTLYCWVLSKVVSGTIFKVFGMMWPGIEPRSPGPLVNTLPTRSKIYYTKMYWNIINNEI